MLVGTVGALYLVIGFLVLFVIRRKDTDNRLGNIENFRDISEDKRVLAGVLAVTTITIGAVMVFVQVVFL